MTQVASTLGIAQATYRALSRPAFAVRFVWQESLRMVSDAVPGQVLDDASLGTRMQSMHVLVAVSSGEIIGTVAGGGPHSGKGHLRGMAVLPQYKGSGVSAELLSAIEAWLGMRGCTHVTLDTTQPLITAMRFYEKHGYSRSGRASDFFGMPLIEYVKQIG